MPLRTATLLAALAASTPAMANVLTYHNGADRHGLYIEPGLTATAAKQLHPDPQFRAQFEGAVYAQPLYWQPTDLLIVVTETNHVLALHAATGALAWQAELPRPAPLSSTSCGNIDPEGITGTPVIDPETATLFLDAQALRGGKPEHLIYALSLADGSTRPGWPMDVAAELWQRGIGFTAKAQGERSALTLSGGRLYVPFGGKYGDCPPYRGTVVEIDPAQPRVTAIWQTRAQGGGIWSQSGLAAAGSHLFATTGNTFGAASWIHGDRWQDGDAVIRLAPGLAHAESPNDFFAPANWATLDRRDLDLGGTGAVPLTVPFQGARAARVLALGKDGYAYLLDQNRLGGIGGALARQAVSETEIKTAPAILEQQDRTLAAFGNEQDPRCGGTALTMLTIRDAKPEVAPLWCANVSGRAAPILTTTDGNHDAIAWTLGAEGDNRLHGFDAETGTPIFESAAPMAGLHHFQTLIAARQHLYVAADGTIYAYTW